MNRTGLSGADIIVHRLRQQQTDASRASPSAGSSTAYMFAMMQAYCLAIAPSIPAVRISAPDRLALSAISCGLCSPAGG